MGFGGERILPGFLGPLVHHLVDGDLIDAGHGLSDRTRFNGLTQFERRRAYARSLLNRNAIDVDNSTLLACAIIKCSTARKRLILKGEMSEWLSSFAATPLRRDISP